ncbi:MAG: hypothetical protein GWO16_15250 [Gammaproteobacteria bacterium]|nr:hypothetical protein [Gammaproteobacteria bacterium]NIR99305.1 hypothetical protein [Gammaproteobacteria bacterium]NIT64245.1 hypothetical protein [Gammaproteobacteria bacterium]NIV21197.1 hypothetical protein [Gammaproteobacteria bacterium]NIX11078.1 hypothetical protein [Gammaproteobacteria bacterium]
MGISQAERGIALLRIALGVWLLRGAMAQVVWLPWPWASLARVQELTGTLALHALDHPSFWVRYVVQQALLPHAELYAGITLIVELLAGASLLFGMLTVLGGLLALLLAVMRGVLSHYLGDVLLGYHLLGGAVALVLVLTRAGRRWGFDALLAGMRRRAWLW